MKYRVVTDNEVFEFSSLRELFLFLALCGFAESYKFIIEEVNDKDKVEFTWDFSEKS